MKGNSSNYMSNHHTVNDILELKDLGELEEESVTCNACYGSGLDRYLDADCMNCWGEGTLLIHPETQSEFTP